MPNTNTAAMYNRIYLEVQRNRLPARRHEKQRGPIGRLLHKANHYYALGAFTVLSWGEHAGLWRWEGRKC